MNNNLTNKDKKIIRIFKLMRKISIINFVVICLILLLGVIIGYYSIDPDSIICKVEIKLIYSMIPLMIIIFLFNHCPKCFSYLGELNSKNYCSNCGQILSDD